MRDIDHLVIAVADLDIAARHWETLGFAVTPRARHPWGTENRLIRLGSAFVELLAPGAPRPEDERDHPGQRYFGERIQVTRARGGGPCGLALTGADPQQDVQTLQTALRSGGITAKRLGDV